jgi:hypothetical protein
MLRRPWGEFPFILKHLITEIGHLGFGYSLIGSSRASEFLAEARIDYCVNYQHSSVLTGSIPYEVDHHEQNS